MPPPTLRNDPKILGAGSVGLPETQLEGQMCSYYISTINDRLAQLFPHLAMASSIYCGFPSMT